MKKAFVFLAHGFETVEAMTAVDYLRRANIEVTTVSVESSPAVESSHQVTVKADRMLADIDFEAADALIIPGGLPGSESLAANSIVTNGLKAAYDAGRLVAAICAGPIVLEAAGIARHSEGTSYPGFEEQLSYTKYRDELAVTDKNVITSRGPATAVYFAKAIVEALSGKDVWEQVQKDILLDLVEQTKQP